MFASLISYCQKATAASQFQSILWIACLFVGVLSIKCICEWEEQRQTEKDTGSYLEKINKFASVLVHV